MAEQTRIFSEQFKTHQELYNLEVPDAAKELANKVLEKYVDEFSDLPDEYYQMYGCGNIDRLISEESLWEDVPKSQRLKSIFKAVEQKMLAEGISEEEIEDGLIVLPGTTLEYNWPKKSDKLILSAVLASEVSLSKAAIKYSVYPVRLSAADIIDIVFRQSHDLEVAIKTFYND